MMSERYTTVYVRIMPEFSRQRDNRAVDISNLSTSSSSIEVISAR